MDVHLVRWPSESLRRRHLASVGAPRLLLVDEGAPAPDVFDIMEDWVRTPATDEDVRARIATLSARAGGLGATPAAPALDDDGVMRHAGTWVHLPPIEHRLAAQLLARFGAVVGREALMAAGWPTGARDRGLLDVHMVRLRRRLEPLGLAVRTIRSRGYLMEATGTRQVAVPDR